MIFRMLLIINCIFIYISRNFIRWEIVLMLFLFISCIIVLELCRFFYKIIVIRKKISGGVIISI